MPASIKSRSTAIVLIALGVIGALMFGAAQGSFASTPLPDGAGKIEVAGELYEFATDTCSITDDGFVASGPGIADGERFWVAASNDSIDIAVGQESIAEAPDDDQLWLTSFNDVSWSAESSRLSASVNMHDDRLDNPAQYRAVLSVNCTPSA